MTEAEWLACTDLQPMLEFLRGKAGERKLRLCAAAWAWSILWQAETNPTPRMEQYRVWFSVRQFAPQLDAAERFADGLIDRSALRAARDTSGGPYNLFLEVCRASHFSFDQVCTRMRYVQAEFGSPSEHKVCACLREVFGPLPIRLMAVNPLWRTPAAVALARSMYEDRRFEDMPLLGDALEEAGCTDEQILSHCRGPGSHVRGCWILDLLLGKN